ncbi:MULTISPECIES: NAD(P)H-quinone oxidoreductase [unclassified Rathayibacter]|uniref:NAD(P)H-quinone oxidoreductase n=1 Tax=unclassified Rathayibacter TaxID=2609250 RepID=UPI000F4B2875|nr:MULTISPECIES: NAD(P)H-quinone oxidoreductase [unclassified Rathayibacter]MCJ1704658.1 NAD(P)H-quinone oxidoreductase [Rathayibacter sp. VKM Ac-2926]ROP45304.1 putative PIG3 family NAD(P)H quinone oxidoreductase [Rathayibacter sp. PhB186]ROS48208.1 putative PIG3 family NAD(P)H quinone oxidoreductase [Rathayibacter sp. PhB185]TCL78847.1 putative PIG3 family NAD(P)H quinone oxidoreductase [Rathayibacter sp. PhB192]TCM24987.1 putative PIG3 family NAD(P)H quinone oxidoreductase [Rathayibacter sp
MLAIRVENPGPDSRLVLEETATPSPGPGEVLLRVTAAGVNRADLGQRAGVYPPPAGASEILGMEVSGTVVGLGEGVTTVAQGDEVCALLSGGGYAEHVVVDAGLLLPVPEGVDLISAAALPETTATVWSNLVLVAGLRAGETVLIHGGGSGIGTTAIQIASAIGARVAVTAGSPRKLDACRALGADILIDYREQDFVERIAAETDGGVDVILDPVGGDYLARDVEALALGGRVVFIGNQSGAQGSLDIGTLMRKRAAVHATTLRARPLEERRAIVAAVRESVWPLVADGTVRPVVDEVIPLAEAERAHERMTASGHIGKLLLTP